ncbi:MAG: TonB C-terminal domain-containing protein [Helicobacteraceae bacterium]|nr:TonB C-terminal domain-containing protein [Candidatus Sulfurimonas ponti]
MARNNSYFFLSGLISLALFAIVLSLFFLMMFSASKINTYALKKDDFISVSLEVVSTPMKKIEKEVIEIKEDTVAEEVKEVDIGNLFSDVWTKDISIEKKKPKPVDNKRLELIQKKIKTSKDNVAQKQEEIINNNEATVTDTDSKKNSSANEVNEYLAKIQAIVYKYFEPPANSQGHTVKAMIELSAIGKVQDFRILTYSSNQALNLECDKIKTRLLGVLFPKNPEGVTSKTIVNITSDKN